MHDAEPCARTAYEQDYLPRELLVLLRNW